MQQRERRKRPRALQACEVCRSRKNRCSEDRPCTYCVDHDLECTYTRTHDEKRLKFVEQYPMTSIRRASRDRSGKTAEQVPMLGQATLQPQDVDDDISSPSLNGDRMSTRPSGEYQRDLHQANALHPGRRPRPRPQSVGSSLDDSTLEIQPSTPTPRDLEVLDTNTHTRNMEFYGASSSISFLRQVETMSDFHVEGPGPSPGRDPYPSRRSLASLLHNTDFQPSSTQSTPRPLPEQSIIQANSGRFYFRVARKFLDAYFSNLHYIQPLFDEEQFMARCEDLWFRDSDPDRAEQQLQQQMPLSFIALYYATLSLGSLVMVWDGRDPYGSDRFTWSRRFFDEALHVVSQLGSATDLEMVRCYYMLAKICQHELNPHVAYLYSGQAARTALAIGINRRPADGKRFGPRTCFTASLTWWAVYCLDIQTSFALGRPDSLGPDDYHTQKMPGTIPSNWTTDLASSRMLQITPFMVEISRIMRRVGLKLYTTTTTTGTITIEERLCHIRALDMDLESWLESLPAHLQIADQNFPEHQQSLKPRYTAGYAYKQAVVLKLRYYNLRMVIHGVFMTQTQTLNTPSEPNPNPIDSTTEISERECRRKCIESACRAIDLIYNTYRTDNYFQTWWYNATYTLFAVSILLSALFQCNKNKTTTSPIVGNELEEDEIFNHIDRAIAILEVMDECVVARNGISIVKRALFRARRVKGLGVQPQIQIRQGEGDGDPDVSSVAPMMQPQVQMQTQGGDGVAAAMGDGAWESGQYRSNDITMASTAAGAEGYHHPSNTIYDDDTELNWLNAFPFDDGQQALFWSEWAREMDGLGT